MTKRHRKKWVDALSLVLPVLLFFAVLNCFTTYLYYQDYQCKMDILTEVAAGAETTGMDVAAGWLKGNDHQANEQGKQLLEQYGYWENKGTSFYVRFRQNIMITGCTSAVLCLSLLTFLFYRKKAEAKESRKRLEQLEQILIAFRENHFEVVLDTEDHVGQERLIFQLEAIGHHIQLLQEEAGAEKESTKEMVSDISHQLKTPVAALDTCFSILLRNNLSETEQQEFRIRCRSALDGLETLLHSLLEISKLETGLIQLDQKTLPIMDTIISAVNRTYPKAAEKGIELIFDCNESLEHCALMQDKHWLGEAIINVLDNAIKYSPEHSKITIRLQKRTGFVRIEIEDQGIGIPQSEYHKIFQRFYRGTAPEVREKSGTGIGLYLSRQIIEQHGGTITVASGKVRKGSTFLIQLPENGLS